ncbi:MAG: hypothetical protein KF850_09895 [Labilithrix sp.]|nr:hypothetical protein [Labilithrix sp.]MBX3212333.1 hypothetical protein [Labilithrix sp.]
MARDSLYGEQIVWSGGPKVVTLPGAFKLIAVVAATISVVALAFAVVIATGLGQHVGSLLGFAAWTASLALGAWRLPLWFRSSARYAVTEKHVIWQRGRLRRSIDRDAISYAIIRWNPSVPGVGDLVLERVVPTGALRRTLSLTLADVEGPDRLWAIVRGLTPSAPLGDGNRPLAQRLDDGERVLWTARPWASRWTARRVATAVGGVVLAIAAVHLFVRLTPPIARVLRAHALPPVTAGVLVGGVALAVLLLAGVACFVGYSALLRPWRLARATRYFVTDRRVLIRRGTEELHLDRERIAYVITAPRGGSARRDVYLVLDGPQARAFSPSGAFGGADEERLVPMFAAVEDADTATAVLHVSRISLTEAREAA